MSSTEISLPHTVAIEPAQGGLNGRLQVPGDKSISHRGLLFGALAEGETEVLDILISEDVQSTQKCLQALGVQVRHEKNRTVVRGLGRRGLKAPTVDLDCGNSGTTMRLMMGVLAGHRFSSPMFGDASLSGRPMKRVAEPLALMGARFELSKNNYAPLTVHGADLKGIDYELKVASAQIKSAVLLAGLLAEGTTTVRGEIHSRDHSERMLKYFGADLDVVGDQVRIVGGATLKGQSVKVPGDPSTAAFWLAAGSMVPGSDIVLDNVGLNPSRTGLMDVLLRMGAAIEIEQTAFVPEPVGRLRVRSAALKATNISAEEVPRLIDELPLFALLATQAHGVSVVRGAEELRIKETDRIDAVAKNLRAMGIEIETTHDGFIIEGPQTLKAAKVDSFHDHRIAMVFAIAGLLTSEGKKTTVEKAHAAAVSYPQFYKTLAELQG
jgi:3-phosphoshikimate 1-carboxyvinyltransferase